MRLEFWDIGKLMNVKVCIVSLLLFIGVIWYIGDRQVRRKRQIIRMEVKEYSEMVKENKEFVKRIHRLKEKVCDEFSSENDVENITKEFLSRFEEELVKRQKMLNKDYKKALKSRKRLDTFAGYWSEFINGLL